MKYRLIRGARILQQLEEASTVPALQQNISRAFPTTSKREHATGEVAVGAIQYTPFIGTKMLMVKTNATSNGHQYQQVIQFNNVVFESADSDANITVTATDGSEAHVQPIELNKVNVQVRCSCLDFYYRFANYNSQDKSLVGRAPPVYVKKTNRPPVNPMRLPGMCKHLIKVVEELQRAKLIK